MFTNLVNCTFAPPIPRFLDKKNAYWNSAVFLAQGIIVIFHRRVEEAREKEPQAFGQTFQTDFHRVGLLDWFKTRLGYGNNVHALKNKTFIVINCI